MRGTFFSKPLEYKLEIDGESWHQGENLSGSLNIVYHDGKEFDLGQIGCHLCFCSSKKYKSKDPKGIILIESQLLNPGQSNLDFNFKLSEDCRVTEGPGSLYLICGDLDFPFEVGGLELKVLPAKAIISFVNIFEQFYRFKVKAFKNKKGFIEAPVIAPQSNEWAPIQKLAMQMKLSGEDLEVTFLVNLKKLSFDSNKSTTVDEKKEIKRTLGKKVYETFGTTNQDGIREVLTEMLDQIKLKPMA